MFSDTAPHQAVREHLKALLAEARLRGDGAPQFFTRVLELARAQHLLSDEHFTVDGTLIEARAGQKSFRRTDGEDRAGATSAATSGASSVATRRTPR